MNTFDAFAFSVIAAGIGFLAGAYLPAPKSRLGRAEPPTADDWRRAAKLAAAALESGKVAMPRDLAEVEFDQEMSDAVGKYVRRMDAIGAEQARLRACGLAQDEIGYLFALIGLHRGLASRGVVGQAARDRIAVVASTFTEYAEVPTREDV